MKEETQPTIEKISENEFKFTTVIPETIVPETIKEDVVNYKDLIVEIQMKKEVIDTLTEKLKNETDAYNLLLEKKAKCDIKKAEEVVPVGDVPVDVAPVKEII